MTMKLYVDGGSRGNPGPAGAGVVLRDGTGRPLLEAGYALSRMTNNAAEYHGLIRGLDAALAAGADEISIFSDSELMVRQILGEYRVRNEKLRPLFEQVRKRLLRIGSWQIQHVPRRQNALADELANAAMDAGEDVIRVSRISSTGSGGPTTEPTTQKASAPTPAIRSGREILLVCSHDAGPHCPARQAKFQQFDFSHTLPAGLCIHAAQAILPTILTLMTAPEETLTTEPLILRCPHKGCNAVFRLSVRMGG